MKLQRFNNSLGTKMNQIYLEFSSNILDAQKPQLPMTLIKSIKVRKGSGMPSF